MSGQNNVRPPKTAKRIRYGSRLRPDVYAAMEERADKGWNGVAIATDLRLKFSNDAPAETTVQGYLRERAPLDPKRSWSLENAPSNDDTTILLLVLRNLVSRGISAGHLTVEVAEWIVRLHRAGGADLQPWGLFRLARLYLRRQAQDEPSADLDAFVAFAPWRDESSWDSFAMAIDQGWVEIPPSMDKQYAKAQYLELLSYFQSYFQSGLA